MLGLIEIPDDDAALSILFFTRQEDIDTYIKLYKEKYPNENVKFKTVRIMKHMVFDGNASNAEESYYKFDPLLLDDNNTLVVD